MSQSTIAKTSQIPAQAAGINDLLGKKSVRATFKLQPEAINLIGLLAAQLGIKQKSLFDYLMEDEEALHAIAQSRPSGKPVSTPRIQKTFVVSQRSLSALDAAAQRSPLSRNDLIERSVQRLLPVLEKERIRYEKRAAGLTRIKDHFNKGNTLLRALKDSLGEEDRLYQSMLSVIDAYAKAVAELDELIEKGKRLSELSLDAWKQNASRRNQKAPVLHEVQRSV